MMADDQETWVLQPRLPYTKFTAREADKFLVSLGYLSGEPTLKMPADAPAMKRQD